MKEISHHKNKIETSAKMLMLSFGTLGNEAAR